MTRSVIFRRPARAEYDAAANRYEQQRIGLGATFTSAVQAAIDRISAQPRMHGVVLRDIRKAVVSGFPYCVYYRERASAIVVLSVFHTARDPAAWQTRN